MKIPQVHKLSNKAGLALFASLVLGSVVGKEVENAKTGYPPVRVPCLHESL